MNCTPTLSAVKEHLQMPTVQTKSDFHKAASMMLLEEVDGKVTVVMLKICKKMGQEDSKYHETFSFPGGKIAKIDEQGVEQTKAEEGCPLMTAARELHEECQFAFDSIAESWEFLNQENTLLTINSGWKFYPVVQYVRPLDKTLSDKFDEAMKHPKICQTEEIAGVTRVHLDAIEEYFTEQNWSNEGLEKRGKLISIAKEKGEIADLSEFAQYDSNLEVEDIAGNKVTIAPYVARSLFKDFPVVRQIASEIFEK